jgi:hypothetical protein
VEDLRKKLFDELCSFLEKNKIRAIAKIHHPENGETIKIKGIVLFKVLRTENPFGEEGIVVHRKMKDKVLSTINGKRAAGKNAWTCAKLTKKSYDLTFKVLSEMALSINKERNESFLNKEKELTLKRKELK